MQEAVSVALLHHALVKAITDTEFFRAPCMCRPSRFSLAGRRCHAIRRSTTRISCLAGASRRTGATSNVAQGATLLRPASGGRRKKLPVEEESRPSPCWTPCAGKASGQKTIVANRVGYRNYVPTAGNLNSSRMRPLCHARRWWQKLTEITRGNKCITATTTTAAARERNSAARCVLMLLVVVVWGPGHHRTSAAAATITARKVHTPRALPLQCTAG